MKFLRFPCFGLMVCGFALSACRHSEKSAAVESGDPKVTDGKIIFPEKSSQLTTLVVAPVKPCTDCRMRVNGRLAWDDDVTVRVFSPFAGRILRIEAAPGARVGKDSPLVVIASPDFGQAQADARKAATDLSLAERNATRLRLLAEHGAVATKDVAAAEADLARAQSETRRTNARLALYGAASDAIDSTYTLKSPIAGVVVERNLNPGQEVRPDQMLAGVERLAAPLFVVTDPSKLWLQLDVTEADAAKIEVGQPLEIRVPTHPGRVFRAVLDYESDALDPMTRTIRARAVVDNSERQLKAEQLVSVEIISPNAAQLMDVPASAVFFKSDHHFVFAETTPGTFVRREIHLGMSHQGRVQVAEGLREGDRVVVDGVMLLEQIWQGAAIEPAHASVGSPPVGH